MPRRMSKAKRRLLGTLAATLLVLAVALPFSCIRRKPDGTRSHATALRAAFRQVAARPVRVLLLDRQPSVTIGTTAPYSIWPAAEGAAALAEGRHQSLPETAVRPTDRGLRLGEHSLAHTAIRITTVRDAALVVNGRPYRGELLIRRDADDALTVVNRLPLDSYLYSVLGSEAYAGWPAAALDAQAVAARTYALWRMIDRSDQPFDLHGSVKDQSYQGVAREDPRLRAAVDRTAGVVLLYQMKLFRCYYHSTCGGHTEAVEDYFPDGPLLPLSGVRCDHCQGSKHYRWERDLSKAELAAALRRDGVALGGGASLEVLSRTKSGRAREVAVEGADGRRRALSASRLRAALGTRVLPSTWFEARDRGDAVALRGRGWGHGVGLCQWGAKGMADAGYSATEILEHYYTGATVERIYNRPTL